MAKKLEDAGYSVWWDRHILGGSEFSDEIERELNAAKAVIVVWSEHGRASRWVRDEAGIAASDAKLVAISLDGAHAPIGFKQFHVIDYGRDGHGFDDLKRSIELRVKGEATSPAGQVSVLPAGMGAEMSAMRRSPLAIAGVCLGAVIVVVAAAFLFTRSPSPKDMPPMPAMPEKQAAAPVSAQVANRLPANRAPIPAKSIAVLPFADMSVDRDQEYFSDGMAEEILNALANIPELRVAGRSSSFAFKGQSIDLREICEILGVAHILEGSVRKQGDRVRISAKLLRASDGLSLWSETYDGTLEDIFDLQEKISKSIAGELEIVFDENAQNRLVKEVTDSKEAYDLFLQGRELSMRMWGEDTMPNAVALLERAVALDPDFAEAWGALSYANYLLPQYAYVEDEEPYLKAAEAAALKGLELDPDQAQSVSMLGGLAVVRHDYARAQTFIDRAFALKPNDPTIVFGHAFNKMSVGQASEAAKICERAMALNPVAGVVMLNCGIVELSLGNIKEAERLARRAAELGFVGAVFTVGDILAMQGEADAAIEYTESKLDFIVDFIPDLADPVRRKLMYSAVYRRNPAARAVVLRGVKGELKNEETIVNSVVLSTLHVTGDAGGFLDAFENHQFANSGFVLSRIWDDRPESIAIRQHKEFPRFAEKIGLVATWNAHGWPDKCRPDEGTDGTGGRFSCS